ncbi:MAG: cellulase family glycosylhydrolase [Bacteroidales bacterium]|nr:cellulase family glycosylhydrolase [Bacteroidales bacterium]
MSRIISAFTLLFVILTGCNLNKNSNQAVGNELMGGNLSVQGTRFLDSFGRQVILSGINKVNKDPKMNFIDNDSLASFEQLSKWGFNCIRLGIIWAGVEPEPGKYDEKYLDKIEERVTWAGRNGIYVLLDMHQDLYSVSFSDGAPLWATITDNQPHITGNIWSDAYFMSPAVQKAFDNFWATKAASDGIGLQDHYANMWKHVASRCADNTTVIGFDIMNEPFNGSQGTYVLPQVLTEYAKLHAEETGKILSQNEVIAIWSDEELRFEALSKMQDTVRYSRVMDAATELNQQFEKNTLQPMYQRVGEAIRERDSTHILFLEHAYFGNTGIRSGIEPVKGKNGKNDPLVAYGAHGYDLLVDTKNYDSQSNSRVELLFSRINETSKRMNVPILVGEWGAFSGNSKAMASSAYFIAKLFEKFAFSNTYWAYYRGIENDLYFNTAIIRPYPQYTGGLLNKYGFNLESGLFNCSWEESPEVKAPTVIYIPDIENLVRESISLSPERSSTVIQTLKNSKAGYLIIPVTGKSTSRSIEFTIRNNQDSFSIEDKNNK